MKDWVLNVIYTENYCLSANSALIGMSDEPPVNCSTCRFFDIDEDKADGSGLCRRYPPQISQLDGISSFPPVPSNCGCGEYQKAMSFDI